MQKIKDNLGLIFISLVTILYLWLTCNLFINFDEVKALKLNEKGDFLAGIFSPLAFLWLVYGYLQQGKELKQNNEALRLQSEELANLVKEQSKQNNIHEQGMNIKRIEAKPKIVFNNASYTYKINDYDGEYFEGTVFYIYIVNFGKIAKDVHIVSNGFERRFHKLESDIVTSMFFSYSEDVEQELNTFQGKPLELEFDISYCDNNGFQYNEKIIVFTNNFVNGAIDVDYGLDVKQ
ncbi:hypothetical protein [Acinetobacter stercoris]|uniref:Uncharacterized protein n=1 Tax=Acinetobacter stercoris TaxID=2126983 RepID=A0A2U3MVL9_9GAMM|nr:hypothetical protein [Acinetobacter stercoris]SPL69466.1 hypothetical protein KPC_0644 [Acinetobacter stercoris]